MSECACCGSEFDLNEEGSIVDGEPVCNDCLGDIEEFDGLMEMAA